MSARASPVDPALAPAQSLFAALVDAAGEDWQNYVCHPFVRGLGDGSLPQPCFRHYLVQDYLFLLVSVRKDVESLESFVIQGVRP